MTANPVKIIAWSVWSQNHSGPRVQVGPKHISSYLRRSIPLGKPRRDGRVGVFFNRRHVRITLSHDRSKEEIKQSVDRSFNDVFKGIEILPVRFVEERKTWQGDTLSFSLTAKMGLVSTPIKGTVEVTDRDITIDVDLDMFERLVPATKVREVVSSRVRGLLK